MKNTCTLHSQLKGLKLFKILIFFKTFYLKIFENTHTLDITLVGVLWKGFHEIFAHFLFFKISFAILNYLTREAEKKVSREGAKIPHLFYLFSIFSPTRQCVYIWEKYKAQHIVYSYKNCTQSFTLVLIRSEKCHEK